MEITGFDIEALAAKIKENCNISDARFWGGYSICGLLLRLRELFRHEKRMQLWEDIPHETISGWIAEREHLWHEMEAREFIVLPVGHKEFSPFDSEALNRILEKKGVVYGAGLGLRMKPSFFLAELLSKESLGGCEVLIAGREFVRDLAVYPAMLRGDTIFARRDALATILWDKFEEIRLKKYKGALAYAFSQYAISPSDDVNESLYIRIAKVAEEEIGTYIRHEVGEAHEGAVLGGAWKEMLSGPITMRVELFVRSIKDVLSDTSEKGTLKYIIEHGRKGSLGFYVASMGGFRTVIFPEIQELFSDFVEREDWQAVEKARRAGQRKARDLAAAVLEIFSKGGETSGEVIEKELLEKMLPRL
jgi:hypothetical protein